MNTPNLKYQFRLKMMQAYSLFHEVLCEEYSIFPQEAVKILDLYFEENGYGDIDNMSASTVMEWLEKEKLK